MFPTVCISQNLAQKADCHLYDRLMPGTLKAGSRLKNRQLLELACHLIGRNTVRQFIHASAPNVRPTDDKVQPGQETPLVPLRSLIPLKYNRAETSGLVCEVKKGEDRVCSIVLE